MSSSTVSEAPNERRARTRNEIKRLIAERNSVLSQFYNLAKHAEDSVNDIHNIIELLEEFCQELVDYLATGHFEIYRRIEEGNERRDEITRLADKIMPRISDTTQIAVAFNDLYENTENISEADIKQLPNHLSRLGKELATRIELEDQFINTMLASCDKPVLAAVNA
jgi:regulator of sigma D